MFILAFGGETSARLAGAKRHQLEQWAYLADMLMKLADETNDLDALLPNHWAHAQPEHILSHRLDESRQNATRTQRRKKRQ